MNKLAGKVIITFLFCAQFALAAAENDIGVVDMDKIFKGYYKTKLSNAKLKKQAEIFKQYAGNLAESQLKLREAFVALRDASLNVAYSETQRESKRLAAQDKYRQLKDKESEIERYKREKRIQIRNQEIKLRKKILLEIRKAIARYAKTRKFTLVLDSSGKTLNDIPSILYYKTEIDFTDEILAILNKGADKK
ncbi:MAG: OmpH family outer membrane protein [Kiritimatiellaeota bacterium]|nr:OmpH family outer membrane protein [Kiritimatiellota bacterium]